MLEYEGKSIVKVYIAGKMQGIPDWGHAKFCAAADALRDQGFNVMNPAETENGDKSKPRPFYLEIDYDYIIHQADAVIVLDNWKNSRGAKSEVLVAREMEKPIYNYTDLSLMTESVDVIV